MQDTPTTNDLEGLLRQFQESDIRELHVRTGSFRLYISKDPASDAVWEESASNRPVGQSDSDTKAPQTLQSVEGLVPPGSVEDASLPEGMTIIRAPYLGHFYRAPKPGESNFVEVGQTVELGADLCLVEVMKLFTAVRAEHRGIVRHILATDGQMVAEGQPLFALEPVA